MPRSATARPASHATSPWGEPGSRRQRGGMPSRVPCWTVPAPTQHWSGAGSKGTARCCLSASPRGLLLNPKLLHMASFLSSRDAREHALRASPVRGLMRCASAVPQPGWGPKGGHVRTRIPTGRGGVEAWTMARAPRCGQGPGYGTRRPHGGAASVADDTRDCRDAWLAWREGSRGLVVRVSACQDSCCCGTTRRHAARRRRSHRGAGKRAGAERAASSVPVVPSRQRVRRALGKPYRSFSRYV